MVGGFVESEKEHQAYYTPLQTHLGNFILLVALLFVIIIIIIVVVRLQEAEEGGRRHGRLRIWQQTNQESSSWSIQWRSIGTNRYVSPTVPYCHLSSTFGDNFLRDSYCTHKDPPINRDVDIGRTKENWLTDRPHSTTHFPQQEGKNTHFCRTLKMDNQKMIHKCFLNLDILCLGEASGAVFGFSRWAVNFIP